MSSIVKRGKRWRASIKVGKARESQSFDTKSAAQQWAADRERDLQTGGGIASREPFGVALKRYDRDVSRLKRGSTFERIRLSAWQRLPIAAVPMHKLDATHIVAWRDQRLQEVSPASVAREMNLLSHVCTIAVAEWKWLSHNPCKGVRRPPEPPPRDRRISDAELELLLLSAGYDRGRPPETVSERVGVALLLAIETGMRAGELCAILPEHVRERSVLLPRTKNGLPREVPLSAEAVRLLAQVGALGLSPVLGFTSGRLDGMWRKILKRTGIVDLHFHDTRHEAITRLSRKLDVLALARMVGHQDIRMLQRYYNATADELAARLD